MQQTLKQQNSHLKNMGQLLHGVSPLNTLNRGYAIITDENNTVVYNTVGINTGEKLSARLKSGRIDCTVTKTYTQ